MKYLNALVLLMVTSQFLEAQMVYSVDYKNQADVSVFVVDYANQADLKVFKTISQSELVSRVFDYYKWKGFNQQYIENLIADRTNVEYKIVESHQKFADLVL